MFKIAVETKVHPTEDSKKVTRALRSIVDKDTKEKRIGDELYLTIESSKYSDLDLLYDLFRQQRILDVARKTLRNGIVGNSTIFYINKQVAFMGKINFCDPYGESPLGPIRIEIEYSNIEHFIDWLAPFTKNGMEVKLVKKFP